MERGLIEIMETSQCAAASGFPGAATPDIRGYLPIPGFPDYRIHAVTLRVESRRSGRPWHEIGLGTQRGVHLHRSDHSGKPVGFRISRGRLLFCATYKIDPTSVPRDVVFDGRGNPMTCAEMNRKIMEKRRFSTQETIIASLKESRKYIDAVLQAYATGDFSEVAALLAGYKERTCLYMRKVLGIGGKAAREELWAETYDAVFKRVVDGKVTMASPLHYMEQTARRMHQALVAARKRIRHFDELGLREMRNTKIK